MREELARRPNVPVLIALQEPAALRALEVDIPTLKGQVADLQGRVLAALGQGRFQVKYRYDGVPALAGVLTPAGLTVLENHPNVVEVALDGVGSGALAQSVPLINADDVHALGLTGRKVVVAVLDSGLDTDHPDLADNLLYQRCFLTSPPLATGCPPAPNVAEDDHGHGTNVTGIITSRGTVSSVGVAPDSLIAAYKILDSTNSGQFSDWTAALNDIIANHPEVDLVNMSLQSTAACPNAAMETAITTLRTMGVATFIAAGNHGTKNSLTVPGCIGPGISVGAVYDADVGAHGGLKSACNDATTAADQVACWSDSDDTLDLLAPGARITSTGLAGGTSTFSGTSQAAPHGAGAAALLLDASPGLTVDQIEALLEGSGVPVTDDLDDADPNTNRTTPRIDALGAVQAIEKEELPLPPPAPCPPAPPGFELDEFPQSEATVTVEMLDPPLGVGTAILTGQTCVIRQTTLGDRVGIGPPPWTLQEGLQDVQTEIVQMRLTGLAVFGSMTVPVTVIQSPFAKSMGFVEEQQNLDPSSLEGPPFNSFFDVFVDIYVDLSQPPDGVPDLVLKNRDQVNMSASISDLPPVEGDTYRSKNAADLVDANKNLRGVLREETHKPVKRPPLVGPLVALSCANNDLTAKAKCDHVQGKKKVGVLGLADFGQDKDRDGKAGYHQVDITVTWPAVIGRPNNSNLACPPPGIPAKPVVGAGIWTGTCTINKATDNEMVGPASFTVSLDNCNVLGRHPVIASAVFRRENPKQDLTGPVTATAEINCIPHPEVEKVPRLANLWLCNVPGAPLCDNKGSGVEEVNFNVELDREIISVEPKCTQAPCARQAIGSFEFEVRYDNKFVSVRVEPGDLLVGRSDVSCASLSGERSVRFRCVTTGKPEDAPRGPGTLAVVNVRPTPDVYSILIANQLNGIATQLINQECQLSDLQGHPIKIGNEGEDPCQDAAVTIRYLEGDVHADCVVDVTDQQQIAFRWGARLGSLLYDERYDLEPSLPKKGDGDIDAKDLQLVYGRYGSTCKDPHPAQDPVDPKAKVEPAPAG